MRKQTPMFLCLAAVLISYSFAQGEDKKITAYKPSPYSTFEELQAGKISVGSLDKSELPLNQGDLVVSGSVGIGTRVPAQKLEVDGKVKAKGLCMGDNCRENWPTLKCAVYNRPPGETGDDYCNSIGKVCFGVMIGSGTSYFNECATPPSPLPSGSLHQTRCCWVE